MEVSELARRGLHARSQPWVGGRDLEGGRVHCKHPAVSFVFDCLGQGANNDVIYVSMAILIALHCAGYESNPIIKTVTDF